VSELTPVFKRAALFDAGATVRISVACQGEAEQLARAYAAATGAVLVPPFDDIRVIAGQATIMREIAAQCPDVGTVVVPISGGGLGAGVASAARSLTPQVRLIGVTMERGASLAAGRPVEVRGRGRTA
jgi:threonine dehydratase